MVVWLPFYDLGDSVGPNQPNHPMDVKLLYHLMGKVLDERVVRLGFKGLPTVQMVGVSAALEKWVECIYVFCKSLGYTSLTPPSGKMVIHPQHSDATSLMVVLNRMFYEKHPEEFLEPKFSQSKPNSVKITDLAWHMAKPQCQRSPWFELPKPGPGPQRELAFYDLGTPAELWYPPFGGPSVSYMLLNQLMWRVGSFNPAFGLQNHNVNSAYPGQAFHKLREVVQTLGWQVEKATCPTVNGTGGQLSAPSLIRPLNYYSLNNPNVPNGPWYWPLNVGSGALAAALRVCPKKSRIFSYY